jgi:hypothetical protein
VNRDAGNKVNLHLKEKQIAPKLSAGEHGRTIVLDAFGTDVDMRKAFSASSNVRQSREGRVFSAYTSAEVTWTRVNRPE